MAQSAGAVTEAFVTFQTKCSTPRCRNDVTGVVGGPPPFCASCTKAANERRSGAR